MESFGFDLRVPPGTTMTNVTMNLFRVPLAEEVDVRWTDHSEAEGVATFNARKSDGGNLVALGVVAIREGRFALAALVMDNDQGVLEGFEDWRKFLEGFSPR
jgi:hypothetical protein